MRLNFKNPTTPTLDERHHCIQPNRPVAAPPSSTSRLQNDTVISTVLTTPADRVDTHHAQPDFKFTQVDPVTFTTLLETSEYCCMDVIPFQKLNDLLLAGIGPILCVFVWFHLFVTVQIFIFLSVFTLSPRWSTFGCFKILITFELVGCHFVSA